MVLIHAAILSHIGNFRSNHEDNFLLNDGKYITSDRQKDFSFSNRPLASEILQQSTEKAIFAVSDGMGGHQAGELASLLAMTSLNAVKDHIMEASHMEAAIDRFQQYVDQVNKEIVAKAKKNAALHGMGATISSLIVLHDRVVGVNVGDSRIYKYDGLDLLQMSKDHTEGQRLLDLKLLTVEEVEGFKSRKALSRYLGMDDEFAILKGEATAIFPIRQREWFLLCSDGLTDEIPDLIIQDVLSRFYKHGQAADAVHALVQTALDGMNSNTGGKDNITVMIVEVSPSSR